MFAYCNNNPLILIDGSGKILDTIFDVVSLGFSVADVITNPADPWAWAGLIGDVVDLIPFVTGVGETTKALGAVAKVADAVGDAKAVKKSSEAALEIIKDASKSLTKGDNFVYISRNADEIIDYVGITNNLDRRAAEWARKGRVIEHYIDGVDRTSARILEQSVIEIFGMKKNGGLLSNAINSISTVNSKYKSFIGFFNSLK